MHKCDWILKKNPDKLGACTREFIPTTYQLTLKDKSNIVDHFEPLGLFKISGIVPVDKLNGPL